MGGWWQRGTATGSLRGAFSLSVLGVDAITQSRLPDGVQEVEGAVHVAGLFGGGAWRSWAMYCDVCGYFM